MEGAFTSTLKRELHLSQMDEAKIDVGRLSQAAQHLYRDQIYNHAGTSQETHKHTVEDTARKSWGNRMSGGCRKSGLCPAM